MRDNYNYVDPDYLYTDQKTGVLRNIQNINDFKLLQIFESFNVAKRLEELFDNPLTIKNSGTLLEIHHYLFQDVYEWAGKVRTVEISKQGKQFFPRDRFREALAYLDSLIADYRKVAVNDVKGIAYFLAIILDSVNFHHPFREGNGRAQREFIRTLALEQNFVIDLNPSDNPDIYKRYMSGTIDGDVQKLQDLIFELMGIGRASAD
jgi:cell filamentation protein